MSLTRILDATLDRTVAPGYSAIGLAVRRRLPGWPADPGPLSDRTVVVTGAAGGVGLGAVRGFAALGADVIAVVRSEARGHDVEAALREPLPGSVTPMVCDVSSLASIRAFAAELAERRDHVDVLVHNAGVMPDEREESADGVELTFATHVLGPYVLTLELADLLAGGGRVINVTSGGMYARGLAANDLLTERRDYAGSRAYAETKRALMVLTEEQAAALRPRGIAVHAMHPGWADTPGVRRWLPRFRAVTRPFLRDDAGAADTIVWLGGTTDRAVADGGGQLWQDRAVRPKHLVRATRETRQQRARLMATLEGLRERVGVPG